MPDPLIVRRVLGDRPFAEVGEPTVAAADPRLGCLVVGGDMGWIPWPNSGRAPIDRWPQYLGTVDGRILDCETSRPAARAVTSAGV